VIHDVGHYRLVATEAIVARTPVCRINGQRTAQPTRWTIQVGARVHVEADPAATLDAQIDRFPWRFLNHSCAPNTRIAGLAVIALRPIQAGEELTFNYNSTESVLASPFECHCGSRDCQGMIRGFTQLESDEQERIRPLLSAYLRRRLGRRLAPAT
jgi:hypothetical protein